MNGVDLDGDGDEDPLNLEQLIDSSSLYPANGREKMRSIFPADYLWSTKRVDNIAQSFRTELGNFDYLDQDNLDVRHIRILEMSGDANNGGQLASEQCVACHGSEFKGMDGSANLHEMGEERSRDELVHVLLRGTDQGMPSWDMLADSEIADLVAFLQSLPETRE